MALARLEVAVEQSEQEIHVYFQQCFRRSYYQAGQDCRDSDYHLDSAVVVQTAVAAVAANRSPLEEECYPQLVVLVVVAVGLAQFLALNSSEPHRNL
jgi:hypothetical protein